MVCRNVIVHGYGLLCLDMDFVFDGGYIKISLKYQGDQKRGSC
ncbi:unnamed protein product [Meloidogyne enterolobii]|uniref:Uncharacterized protein n=2 Tax=Meloidogyne enterolobii TaxID=390850 RepID=A0A6V7Y7F2_MELEN|nr:unnamed protein product [Meloidogyne enterolobii]